MKLAHIMLTVLALANFALAISPDYRALDSAAVWDINTANPGNSLGWDSTALYSTWTGVTVDGSGRVTALDLTGVGIDSLAPSLGSLVALTSLDLSANYLDSVSSFIGNLTLLTSLNLSNNYFSAVPSTISSLTLLSTLDLSENFLDSLPSSIGSLTALTYLSLGNNALVSLPSSIGNLTQLSFLDMSGNSLSQLPTSFGSLSALTSLQLGENNLDSLPATFKNLPAAVSMDVSYNYLPTSITDSLAVEFSNATFLPQLIHPIALTIANPMAQNKVYDGTNVDTITGTLVGAIASSDTIALNCLGTFMDFGVGTGIAVTTDAWQCELTGDSAYKYSLTLPSTLSANISKRTLNIVAQQDTILLGAANPTYTYASDSLLPGDSLTGSLVRNPGDTVGTYAILLGTLSADSNYTINYTGANLVIKDSLTAIRVSSPHVAFTGLVNAAVVDLQGRQVWAGRVNVINDHLALPNLGAGRWVLKMQLGDVVKAVNLSVQ